MPGTTYYTSPRVLPHSIEAAIETASKMGKSVTQVLTLRLVHAIHRNEPDVVDEILDEKQQHVPDINGVAQMGWTPVMWAAHKGRLEILMKLLEWRPDLDRQDKKGSTAVHLASIQGRGGIVQILLDYAVPANVNLQTKNGETPMFLACTKGHVHIVKQILSHRLPPKLNLQATNGRTCLIAASKGGHVAAVKMLLENRADINIQDDKGKTALLHAADRGHIDIVKLLLDQGPNLQLKDLVERSTPLMWAMFHHHDEAALAILKSTPAHTLWGTDKKGRMPSQMGRNAKVRQLIRDKLERYVHCVLHQSFLPSNYLPRELYPVLVDFCC